MATTTPRPTRSLEQDTSRVRSPLARVRSTIYRYLGLEGLAVAGLFVALWFWIGLFLDYGVFKAFLFDWVQETPWAARLTLLVLVLSGLLALLLLRVVLRLFREFSDTAMALVLEKRFPDLLGDRLITAVELSDPEAAEEFGYSPALVRETIREASDRVDQVPVNQVFDWRRLFRMGLLVGLLSLGLYALAAGGFCAARSVGGEGEAMAGVSDFNEVATIWAERNVLLRNTIWPRKAYLEVLPFEGAVGLDGGSPDPAELRIPQGTQPPPLRVRAWKHVIADGRSAEGWRLLTWDDLEANPSFLAGVELPALPAEWKPRDDEQGMTVDEVELFLEQASPKTVVGGVALEPIRAALEAVGETASDRANRRVVRKLQIPQEVTLVYRSNRATNTAPLTPTAGNEFTGNFAELKESVSYTVRGEDYVTARRDITVVERPRVDSLESREERPAYLFYLPPTDGSPEDVRQKRQPLEASKLSVSGETTTLEVPAGTLVVLEGVLTKPLVGIDYAVEPKDAKTFAGEKPEKVGERGFRMRLPNVRREQRFKFVYRDNDGVEGERKVVIAPRPDTTPRVREFNPDEVIRKGRGNEGYVIAAGCRIPFKGRLGDDHGLARVRYAVKVTPADFLSEQKVRGIYAIGALPLIGPGGTGLQAAGYMIALDKEIASAATEESGPEQVYDLPAFADMLKRSRLEDGTAELLPRGTVATMLQTPQKPNFRRLTRDFALTPDRWNERFAEKEEDERFPSRWFKANDFRSPLGGDLPLWKLSFRDREGKDRPLKEADDTKPQKRFVVEVRLVVDDNFLDGDLDAKGQPVPNTGASGETFTFTVVPDNELLSRIAEEEEAKFREMEKAVKPIRENLLRLEETSRSLTFDAGSVDANVLTGYIARCDAIGDVLKTSQQDVKSVLSTYERIVKEMRVNQLNEDILTKVYGKIYVPLTEADRLFESTSNDIVALRRAMDDTSRPVAGRVEASGQRAGVAKKEMRELYNKLDAILREMEGLSKLNDLIQQLALIERQEEDLQSRVTKVLQDLIRRQLEGKD